jgi:hypothetical protein
VEALPRANRVARGLPVKINRAALFAAIDQEFAIKIAAAQMFAPRDSVQDIIAALKREMAQKKQVLALTLKSEQAAKVKPVRPLRQKRQPRNYKQLLISFILVADLLWKICYKAGIV